MYIFFEEYDLECHEKIFKIIIIEQENAKLESDPAFFDSQVPVGYGYGSKTYGKVRSGSKTKSGGSKAL
jgi:hypothetical protein